MGVGGKGQVIGHLGGALGWWWNLGAVLEFLASWASWGVLRVGDLGKLLGVLGLETFIRRIEKATIDLGSGTG